MSRRLSVIVPVLNEAARIEAHLSRLVALAGVHEVIVADGGSDDGTIDRARAVPGVRVIASPRGRGPQMNAGARVATGDVLWFVHADAQPPEDATAQMREALREPGVIGGAFRIRTEADGGRGWPVRLLWLADLRSSYSGVPYGDQAVFVRRHVFEAIGGFLSIPLFEDVEFSQRLRRAGRLRVLPGRVHVSGRRFVQRPIASAVYMNVAPWLYRAGVPPALLARWYGQVR